MPGRGSFSPLLTLAAAFAPCRCQRDSADERAWEAALLVRGTLAGMDAPQQIIEAAEARAAALADGDAERLADLLHENFRWTTHVGATYNKREYIRRNTEGHTRWRSQQLHSTEVVVVGETAVLCAEVADVVMSGPEESETFRMPMTQVWVRVEGTWACLAGHAGPRLT